MTKTVKKIKPKLCKCGCGEQVNPYNYLRYKWVDETHRKHWLNTSEEGQKAKVKQDRKKLNVKKAIKPLSDKRKLQNKAYLTLRNVYLTNHSECEYKFAGCTFNSTEIDHTKKRLGELLTNVRYFKATCRNCHEKRHKENLKIN